MVVDNVEVSKSFKLVKFSENGRLLMKYVLDGKIVVKIKYRFLFYSQRYCCVSRNKKCKKKSCEKELQKSFIGEYSDVFMFLLQYRGLTG